MWGFGTQKSTLYSYLMQLMGGDTVSPKGLECSWWQSNCCGTALRVFVTCEVAGRGGGAHERSARFEANQPNVAWRILLSAWCTAALISRTARPRSCRVVRKPAAVASSQVADPMS